MSIKKLIKNKDKALSKVTYGLPSVEEGRKSNTNNTEKEAEPTTLKIPDDDNTGKTTFNNAFFL